MWENPYQGRHNDDPGNIFPIQGPANLALQLSDIAKQINSEIHFEVPQEKIKEFRALEKISRKVVIADNNENDLILYLSFIRGKWVLTIIDKITTDCST